MALKTKVKISEVNNLSDARFCAAMGVGMIGFSLDENHPRFVDINVARDIANWISGVEVVGEFTGTNLENIDYLAKELKLDYIQIAHPFEFQQKHLHKPAILKVIYSEGNEGQLENIFEKYSEVVQYFLIESEAEFDLNKLLSLLSGWCKKFSILLGAGIEVTNLDLILNQIKPAGISLKGGDEIKPGLKNFDELSEILEHLEAED